MKVNGIRTVRVPEHPQMLWLEVLTDEGISGLGETCLGPATVEPHKVNGFDTVSGGKRAFGESTTVGKEGLQQVGDLALAVGVGESWRWTHDDVSVSIGLDPIGEFGQARIGQDFGPAGKVKRGLSLEIWKLDGDGHCGNLH